MVPTLQLYNTLKAQGIVPQSAEIRSVYRNPSLNVCAGRAGKANTSPMERWISGCQTNTAMIFIPIHYKMVCVNFGSIKARRIILGWEYMALARFT